jgi:hypothetical protein
MGSNIGLILTIVFGVSTIVTSILALKYKRLEYKRKVEDYITTDKVTGLFLSRESMSKYLVQMYDRADVGDTIWGQCVGCANYPQNVRDKILEAASKGIKFKMIFNKYSAGAHQLLTTFKSLKDSDIVLGSDNQIRIQGISHKEVVIAFPSVNSYTALLCKDRYFVEIMKTWFDNRVESLKENVS